jgi:tetratricopeptide (TPR) repeat protein
LGLAYFEINHLAEAEKAVKSSLFRDTSRAEAWHFLALLRTAAQDFEGALEICNIQLDLQIHPDINLCLLKTAILSHYDQSEVAIDLAKAIFGYWICKRDGMTAWLGPLTEPSISGQTTGETDASSTMTMNRFKQRFLGRHYKEHQGDLEADEATTVLRFAEIANRFPKPPEETKRSLLGLTDLIHFFTCRERLAIHEHLQYTKVHKGGKRFGIAKQLWLWLSKLYLADRSYREAELAAEAAFAVDELDPEVYYRIGRVMEAQGRTDEAIANYEKGILLDERHPGCHLALARRYSLSSEPSRLGLAQNHALWVLRVRPSDYRAMNVLAQVCIGLGQDAEAGKWFTKALRAQEISPLLPISPRPFIFMTSC